MPILHFIHTLWHPTPYPFTFLRVCCLSLRACRSHTKVQCGSYSKRLSRLSQSSKICWLLLKTLAAVEMLSKALLNRSTIRMASTTSHWRTIFSVFGQPFPSFKVIAPSWQLNMPTRMLHGHLRLVQNQAHLIFLSLLSPVSWLTVNSPIRTFNHGILSSLTLLSSPITSYGSNYKKKCS